jgi:hypothetical protein
MKNDGDLKRLIISEMDLLQALDFGKFILRKRLHDKTSKEAKLVHLAFNTSLIVSYARPFLGSRNSEDRSEKPSLPKRFRDRLTKDEKRLHQIVITSRKKEYAHSDLDSYGMKISTLEGTHIPHGRNPFIPLTKTQTTQLVAIIENLLAEIAERRIQMQDM